MSHTVLAINGAQNTDVTPDTQNTDVIPNTQNLNGPIILNQSDSFIMSEWEKKILILGDTRIFYFKPINRDNISNPGKAYDELQTEIISMHIYLLLY